jgi:hypothetical protein
MSDVVAVEHSTPLSFESSNSQALSTALESARASYEAEKLQ